MTVRTFRDLLGRRPFEPFRLVMSSGRAFEVRHPEMADLTRTDMWVAAHDPDDGAVRRVICSLLHVSCVEPTGPAGLTGPAPPPPPAEPDFSPDPA